MRQKRRGIFETNSSSVHTLTIEEWKDIDEYNFDPIFKLREDHYWDTDLDKIKQLTPKFLDFGWSEPYFEGSRESFKLSYLITLLACEMEREDDERIVGKQFWNKETNSYQHSNPYEELKADVNRVVAQHKIVVNWPEIRKPKNDDEYDLNGSIDHQSYEFARMLFKYLFAWASDRYYGSISKETQEDYDNRLHNYLFNPRVKLDISSDG